MLLAMLILASEKVLPLLQLYWVAVINSPGIVKVGFSNVISAITSSLGQLSVGVSCILKR